MPIKKRKKKVKEVFVIKRKRGRPKKVSTELKKTKKVKKVKKAKDLKVSTNTTNVTNTECFIKRGRGRPRKISTETIAGMNIQFPSTVIMRKHLGFCPNNDCTCGITDGDYVGQSLKKRSQVICIRCGWVGEVKQLANEASKDDTRSQKHIDKRDYLDDLPVVPTADIIPEHLPELPEEFKGLNIVDDWD